MKQNDRMGKGTKNAALNSSLSEDFAIFNVFQHLVLINP